MKKEIIIDNEPIVIVNFSWIGDGFKNILMFMSSHVDSDQVLYSPEVQL